MIRNGMKTVPMAPMMMPAMASPANSVYFVGAAQKKMWPRE